MKAKTLLLYEVCNSLKAAISSNYFNTDLWLNYDDLTYFQQVLKAKFGLIVEWNGRSTVKVKVPSSFGGSLCGLCGNGNSDPEGDFVNPGGEQVCVLKNNVPLLTYVFFTLN